MTALSFHSFLVPKNYAYFDCNRINGRVVLKGSDVCIEKNPSCFERAWNFQKIKEENQKIWALFQKELLKEPSPNQEKVKKALAGCSVEADLEKKHLDIVLTALRSIRVSDLGDFPEKLSSKQIAKKIEALFVSSLPLREESDCLAKERTIYEFVCSDALSLAKQRVAAIAKLAEFQTIPEYWEHFTRNVIARNLEEGMILPSFRGEDFYYIYKKINQGGLVAYALKPLSNESREKPIVCFRPTQIVLRFVDTVLETLLDDLHLNGVGYGGFQAARKELDQLMKDPGFRKENEKIIVAGYSLAGAYAQYFTAHQENWKSIAEAVFFNDPGVNKSTAERFARKVNQRTLKEGEAPVLSLFRTEGDLIDHHGELHLGAGVMPSSQAQMQLTLLIPPEATTKLDRHFNCYFSSAEKQFFDLKEPKYNHLLDNAKRGTKVLFWESCRRFLGLFLRPFTLLLNWFFKRFFQEKLNLS